MLFGIIRFIHQSGEAAMSRKTMLVILIFVIIGGAIAGTFVFLNQSHTSGPVLPSGTGIGGTALQSVSPYGPPETAFTFSTSSENMFI
jgi:flagellar basal body-associated protein FliL